MIVFEKVFFSLREQQLQRVDAVIVTIAALPMHLDRVRRAASITHAVHHSAMQQPIARTRVDIIFHKGS